MTVTSGRSQIDRQRKPVALSQNARLVVERRYLAKDDAGKPIEYQVGPRTIKVIRGMHVNHYRLQKIVKTGPGSWSSISTPWNWDGT